MSYPNTTPPENQEELPIRSILLAALQHWYYFAIACVCTLLLGWLYIQTQPEEYMVRASILLKPQGEQTSSDQFMKEMGLFVSAAEVEDKIGILTSTSLIEEALSHLPVGISFSREETFPHPVEPESLPFQVLLDSNHLQLVGLPVVVTPLAGQRFQIEAEGEKIPLYDLQKDEVVSVVPKVEISAIVAAGDTFDQPHLKFRIIDRPEITASESEAYRFQIHALYDLVNHFQKKLLVSQINDESNILQLRTSGSLIKLEKDFLAALLDAYTRHEISTKSELGRKAVEFIDRQISEVTDSLSKAENQMEHYRSRSEIIDVATTSSTLTTQLVRFEEERADVSMAINYYQSVQTQIDSDLANGKLFTPFSMEAQNPMLTSLMMELSDLMQQKAKIAYTSSSSNPISERLDQQIADTRGALQNNIRSLIRANEVNLSGLDNKISSVQAKIRSLPRNEKELNQLERQFESIGSLYTYLIEKRTEAGIALGNTSSDFLILDKARLSSTKPVSPQKALILLACLLAGLGIPFLFIVIRFLFNERITDFSEIASLTEIPVLGTIARNDTNQKFLTPVTSYSLLAESFRSIRIHLNYLTTEKPKQLVVVSSSKSGEGKSFFSANLSSTLAQSGKQTLLVDLDLRMPSQEEYLGEHTGLGLSEYLQGAAKQAEIITPTPVENLDIIFAGAPHHNPIDLIDTPRFKALLTRLRKKYDYLIFDLPPLGMTSDYFILKRYVDYTIFITREKISTIQDIRFIDELYQKGKVKDIGIVVNDAQAKKYHNYGYGYGNPAAKAKKKKVSNWRPLLSKTHL